VVLIVFYGLYFELKIMDACLCLYAHNGFCIEVIALCFRLEIMDACLYLYVHNWFMYIMNKSRI
jgi:hypothetical protein